jgi:hypothetical protein
MGREGKCIQAKGCGGTWKLRAMLKTWDYTGIKYEK